MICCGGQKLILKWKLFRRRAAIDHKQFLIRDLLRGEVKGLLNAWDFVLHAEEKLFMAKEGA